MYICTYCWCCYCYGLDCYCFCSCFCSCHCLPDVGSHNALATLLLNGGESIVKHLVSRADSLLGLGPIAVALFVYTILAIGVPSRCVRGLNLEMAQVSCSKLAIRMVNECINSREWAHARKRTVMCVSKYKWLCITNSKRRYNHRKSTNLCYKTCIHDSCMYSCMCVVYIVI